MESTKDLLIDDAQKKLFNKMLDINVQPKNAKKIMSFWMFLESKGFKNIYENILVADDNIFRGVCAEAEIALAFFECENKPNLPISSCPMTWKFASDLCLSPTEVLGDKQNVFTNILAFQNEVCNSTAFEDILIAKKENLGKNPNAAAEGSKLNPSAEEFIPLPENERSLFMTFSKGRPLSKIQILDYFQRKYGDCVDDVFIHMPLDREPEFGKIIFKFSWIPNSILQDKESVILKVADEKTIGLKKYKASS